MTKNNNTPSASAVDFARAVLLQLADDALVIEACKTIEAATTLATQTERARARDLRILIEGETP